MKAAAAELVHLVEHEHGIGGAGLAQALDDVAGQCAHIGAPVTADFRLVVKTAQACANELAAHGVRDALAERGLADAGRADEAEDRAVAVRIKLSDREKFENALLDLLEAVMLVVQDFSRGGDVDDVVRALRPGEFDQPVEIGPDHRIFAGRLGHALQALQLLQRVLLRLLRHAGLGDRFAQLLDLGLVLLVLAELLLDGLHLLAKEIFALLIGQVLLGLLADVAGQLQDFEPMAERRQHLVQPRLDVDRLQDLLAFLRLHVHEAGDQIGALGGRVQPLDGVAELRRGLGQQRQHFERTLLQLVQPRLRLGPLAVHVLQPLDARGEMRVAFQEFDDPEPLLALADHVMGAVGCCHVAQHAGDRAGLVQLLGRRPLDLGIELQHGAEGLLRLRRGLRRRDRERMFQRERHHHAREQHDMAKRQDDHGVGRQGALVRLRDASRRSSRCRRRPLRAEQVSIHGRLRSAHGSFLRDRTRQPWRSSRWPIS